jgi:outer membrane cobalamin receptor
MELLTARIPSLRIQGGESGSGSRNDIRIRGSGSVVGSNQPSLYIDGVRGDLELLADLPSTDVVRVQVLRGPSASALYQDAVNGVILVETIRGRLPVKVRKPGPPPA